ncbi:aminoglycoside phosphotransferase family protein [Paracoccus xiamenensis]|uniref:aminoglycoside phosphotransferase family protein n=1 Tax=Paracoccus xiamenensis TaxID=2714901 RepID=UPI002E2DFF45|nr:aminoglycoside phosphotransferase family protein [Paracoccus xiamenensis]
MPHPVPPSLAPWLVRWQLRPDGPEFATHHARLMPVRQAGRPAMLKLTAQPDEIRGAAVMAWWAGSGAAPVLNRDGGALLLARAEGTRALSAMARGAEDDRASRIICETARHLHQARPNPPDLMPLSVWFRDLETAAARHGGLLAAAWATASTLLAAPRDQVVLHGDLHHDNILDFGASGWLAIDPHGLRGERGFDFANIFTNPDLSDPSQPMATRHGVFQRRLAVVCEAAGLERRRLLQWILAWTGLSAAWFIADDDPNAAIDLQIAEAARAELSAMAEE